MNANVPYDIWHLLLAGQRLRNLGVTGLAVTVISGCCLFMAYGLGYMPTFGRTNVNHTGSVAHGGSSFGLSTMYLVRGQVAFVRYNVASHDGGGLRIAISRKAAGPARHIRTNISGKGIIAWRVPESGLYRFSVKRGYSLRKADDTLTSLGKAVTGVNRTRASYSASWGAYFPKAVPGEIAAIVAN